jgi:hypothetical protein
MKATTKTATPEQGPRKRGEGSIYQRGDTWWIAYYRRGKQKRESSHSTNREDAEKLLALKTKQLWAEKQGLQAFVPKAEKVYVDELLDALEKAYKVKLAAKLDEPLNALDKEEKSARSQLLMKRGLAQFRSHLKPIRAAFGDMRAVDVTTKRVDDYIDQRLEQDNKAPATVNRETQLLGQAFGLGIEDHRIVAAPHIRHLPERNVRKGFFERGDFEAVVAKLPAHWPELMELKHKTSTATWCILSFISKELPRTLVRAAYADCRRDLQSRDRHALGRAPDDSNRASETRRVDPSRSVSPGKPTLQLPRLQPAVHDR